MNYLNYIFERVHILGIVPFTKIQNMCNKFIILIDTFQIQKLNLNTQESDINNKLLY